MKSLNRNARQSRGKVFKPERGVNGTMNYRQIKKERRKLSHVGRPADLRRLKATLASRLRNDVAVAKQQMEGIARNFRRLHEAWWTQEVPIETVPFPINSDLHIKNVYLAVAVLTGIGEACLAGWIFDHWGVPWWYGVVTAVIVTGVIHGAFHFMFFEEASPKCSVYLIRRFVVLPSSIAFLLSFGLFALARYVYDTSVVLVLLPALSIGLWLGTLSLLMLSGSLFTVAHMLGWSGRLYGEYRSVDDERQASESFLRELHDHHDVREGGDDEDARNEADSKMGASNGELPQEADWNKKSAQSFAATRKN